MTLTSRSNLPERRVWIASDLPGIRDSANSQMDRAEAPAWARKCLRTTWPGCRRSSLWPRPGGLVRHLATIMQVLSVAKSLAVQNEPRSGLSFRVSGQLAPSAAGLDGVFLTPQRPFVGVALGFLQGGSNVNAGNVAREIKIRFLLWY